MTNLTVKIVFETLVEVVPNNQNNFLQWIQGKMLQFSESQIVNLFILVKILGKITAEPQKSTTKGQFCTLEYKRGHFC